MEVGQSPGREGGRRYGGNGGVFGRPRSLFLVSCFFFSSFVLCGDLMFSVPLVTVMLVLCLLVYITDLYLLFLLLFLLAWLDCVILVLGLVLVCRCFFFFF